MNPLRSALFAIFLLGPAAAFAQMTDSEILNKIHSIDQTELKAAELAKKSSSNADVKAFAAHMTGDHKKAERDVTALASKKHITLDDATPGPDPLASMSGADFDRGYATKMVKGHQDALDFLAKADAQTSDPAIKKLVEKLQPTVAHHKEMADKLHGKFSAMNTP